MGSFYVEGRYCLKTGDPFFETHGSLGTVYNLNNLYGLDICSVPRVAFIYKKLKNLGKSI